MDSPQQENGHKLVYTKDRLLALRTTANVGIVPHLPREAHRFGRCSPWCHSEPHIPRTSHETVTAEAFPVDRPKTVFFWAPVFKWGLVVAGFSDMTRPPEKLSVSQSCVITATGIIWSRYCLVIIPKNWALFAVNFFLGMCGSIQLIRIWRYNQQLKQKGVEVPQP
ncbi:mitochondrial pyruvate carrier 2-like [Sinocyclocheilus grahami]|uniref:mitochondrial pyruvate carrier 2-like n=1 Tax=Sinocyclocheilus grahami TaxID=75366 RepID=UPI0007ACBA81|nr:PREDICTED: mitochondrial pyruvate carrier 2-like [Sinocyclocheilus grahami]